MNKTALNLISIIRTYLFIILKYFFFYYSTDDHDGQKGWCHKPTKLKFQSNFTRKILMLSKRNESTEVYYRTWLHVLNQMHLAKMCWYFSYVPLLVFRRVFFIKIVFNRFKLVYNWIILVNNYSPLFFPIYSNHLRSVRTHGISSMKFSR